MRRILLSLLALSAVAFLAGCGTSNSSTIHVPPDPTGGNNAGFSNASLLNGDTYIFTAHGFDRYREYAVVGAIVSDGAGSITSGTRDIVYDDGTQYLDEAITGTYAVNQDGRGQLVLNGASGRAIYRFVLSSTSSGKLFQDGSASNQVIYDAIGSIDLQSGTPAVPAASSTYVISLNGEDSALSIYGAVGGLTYGSGGAFTGSLDENDSGAFSSELAASGNLSLSGTRGSGTLTTPGGPNSAAHNFVVYYVSPDKMELLSTDKNFLLFGREELQDNTIGAFNGSGDEAFQLSGFDSSNYNVAETGRFTLDGTGNITGGVHDYYQGGSLYNNVAFTGSYTGPAANGRWTAALSPASGPLTGVNLTGWQISSTHSALLVTSANNSSVSGYQLVATGEQKAQTTGLTTADVQGNFAQYFAGYSNNVGSVESTGNCLLQATGSSQGTIDFQTDYGGLFLDNASAGSFAVDATTGRGSGQICGTGDNANFYTVDSENVYFILSDSGLAIQGSMVLQQP